MKASDPGEAITEIAMAFWLASYLALIFTFFIPVLPGDVGGPFMVGGLCGAALSLIGVTIYSFFER